MQNENDIILYDRSEYWDYIFGKTSWEGFSYGLLYFTLDFIKCLHNKELNLNVKLFAHGLMELREHLTQMLDLIQKIEHSIPNIGFPE